MKLSKSSFLALFGLLFVAGCRARIERLEWPVMGTVAAVQTRGFVKPEDEASRVRGLAHSVLGMVERRMNAHDPKSNLSRLAVQSDKDIADAAARDERTCYEAAFALARASGGAFNPRWRGTNTLDLGAIAKGFAVDRLEAALKGLPPLDADTLFDLGGNLKSFRGDWKTGVKSPAGADVAATVDLHAGEALATSATYYRGAHIVDGRTGRAVTNGVASVTVLAPSAMWADGLSTTLFILGPDDGRTFLDNHLSDLTGGQTASVLWILRDGSQITYGDARFSRR